MISYDILVRFDAYIYTLYIQRERDANIGYRFGASSWDGCGQSRPTDRQRGYRVVIVFFTCMGT